MRDRLVYSAAVAAVVSLVGAFFVSASYGGAVSWSVVAMAPVLGCCGVGVLLSMRVRDNPLGWVFLCIGVVLGVGDLCDAYAARAVHLTGGTLAAVAANLLGPAPLLLLPVVVILFPDGRLPSRRWRWVAMVWAAAAALFTLAVLGTPGPMGLNSGSSLPNPIGIGGSVGTLLGVAGFVAITVIFGLMALGAASLVVRFRRATGELRQQLKWFGTAATVVALVGAASPFLWTLRAPWSTVLTNALWNVSGTGLVVATGLAILRYRLYEIDVIIQKTLVYTSLIAALAVIYLTGIYLIDTTLQTLTGQSGAFAVTLSTLAVAAAFQRLRVRIQRAVDHRFYRQKYDAAHTLEVFTNHLRNQIDLDALHTDIITLVTTTLQPRHTSLWLRPPASRAGRTPIERRSLRL